MVKDAYLSMKLSNYCKSKELLSTQDSVLWCYKEPILTSGGGGGGGGGEAKQIHANATLLCSLSYRLFSAPHYSSE